MAEVDGLNGEQQVNLLITKIMTERYCRVEANDFDACIQNFVPQQIDGSHVDQVLQRKGIRKCEPYKEAAQRCLQDEKKQQNILRAAAASKGCKEERAMLQKCQTATRGATGACEKEALDMMICGLVPMAKKFRKQQQTSSTTQVEPA
jgi:hypothetical protein